MSADLIARGLALQTRPFAVPATSLAARRIPADVELVRTSGYASTGHGGGTYVADALATAALAAAHPRFCKVDSAGRHFRLVPDPQGFISVEQGGAIGDGVANDRPAIQATVDYASAVGIWRIAFLSPGYALWMPVLSAPPADQFAPVGAAIIAQAGMHLEGATPATTLNLKGHLGGSLETQTQSVSGYPTWRGAGVFVVGGTNSDADAYNVLGFSMKNLIVDGGGTISPAFDAVDLTHKGFRVQDTVVGKIVMEQVELRNFHGEIYYMNALSENEQWLTNCKFHGSDQCALQPSRGYVWAVNCEFGNASQAAEFQGGIAGGRLVGCRFYHSGSAAFTSGQNGFLYNQNYPQRVSTDQPPWIDLVDCDFHNIDSVIAANFVRISGRATDTQFFVGTGNIGVCTSVQIDVEATIDQGGIAEIFYIQGPGNLTTVIPGAAAPNYVLPLQDVHLRARIRQTKVARDANRFIVGARIQGYVEGASCSLHLEGYGLSELATFTGSNAGLPLMTTSAAANSHVYGATQPYGSSQSIVTAAPHTMTITSCVMRLENFGASPTGVVPVAPASFGAYPHTYGWGQRCRIEYSGYNPGGAIYSFAKDGTNLRLNADRALYQPGDFLELEYNASTQKWCEVAYHAQKARLFGSATYDAPSIAAAGTTTTTLTVTGATLGDKVDGISFGVSLAGLTATGYVSANNTVTVVLHNPTAGAINLASTTLRVEVTK